MNWNFLWTTTDGLLLDSNHDGHPDGIAACLVPLDAPRFTPGVWAAVANFGARLGLESAAARLPLLCLPEDAPKKLEAWQIPLLLTLRPEAALNASAPNESAWAEATATPPLHATEEVRVTWLDGRAGRALWIHGATAAALANALNAMAASTSSEAEPEASGTTAAPAPGTSLDLASLYHAGGRGLFSAGPDGFTAEANRHRIMLGPQTDAATGAAAVDLAARLGLESSGLCFPVAVAAAESEDEAGIDGAGIDAADATLRMGFGGESEGGLEPDSGSSLGLNAVSARYLAETYPFLESGSQRAQDEARTLGALCDAVRDVVHGHTPLARLALAETQAGRPLHLYAPGSDDTSNLRHTIFRQEWSPPDGLGNVARVQGAFFEHLLPRLQTQAATGTSHRVTLFCNAPGSARQALAAELRETLAASETSVELSVLPAHKAGLAWVREEQLPLLQERDVARVVLHFSEFRPGTDDNGSWLDLPHRWLQEIFPADEVLRRELNLPEERVEIEMMAGEDSTGVTYRLEAFDPAGEPVHAAELRVLWGERLYLAGMPAHGVVHPSGGGMVWQRPDGGTSAWLVPGDSELFWDFYQQSVLPAVRQHVLGVGGGRPTPESEPFFETLTVDGYFGGPDEPLGVYQEFVSVGEALHEDIYFNTLDYLAALGEEFSGRSIEAAGQVLPFIHDYYDEAGLPVGAGPRATVTLTAPRLPTLLPETGTLVGDRRDMPQPHEISVHGLRLDEGGTGIQQATVHVHYGDAATAGFAARILRRWGALSQGTGLPHGLNVEIVPCAGGEPVDRVRVSGPAAPAPFVEPVAAIACDSAVIGPAQLAGCLRDVGEHPGVRTWRVGQSYQGRTGHAVDVILPLHGGQTHVARRKLALQKPTAFIIARHHANEVASTTAVFDLARELADPGTLQALLHRVNVVFLPMANPDGAAAHYRLMAEHPRWKHHAARFNAAGQEFGRDHFNPHTPFGEARFRRTIWDRWLPDAIVDNHGVPSHEWCQPFAGYNSPPRFRVSYHTVQAMLYGIISFVDDAERPELRAAAEALREAVSSAVAEHDWLYQRNQYWLARYAAYGNRWTPDVSPLDVHNGMLFFFRGASPSATAWRRNFTMRHPQITQLEWITEVADETAQGAYLEECAAAHRIANRAMLQLLAGAAQPPVRHAATTENGRTHILFRRGRQLGG